MKIPNEEKEIIRSSKVSISESNFGKAEKLSLFISEYKRICELFIEDFWPQQKIPRLISTIFTKHISEQTWLSARIIQACAKQTSGIIRGVRQKQKQRIAMHKILVKENKLKAAERLQKYIDKVSMSKPTLKRIQPQLD